MELKVPDAVVGDHRLTRRNVMANPQVLDAFAEYARTQRDYRLSGTAGDS